MIILVTGSKGQLGHDVVVALKERNIEYIAADRDEFDITNELEVQEFIIKHKPDAVIHCAAYTAVDLAEDEVELCYKVNEDGTKYIASACKKIDAKMIYISTDYVFGGNDEGFYKPQDKTNPISAYGRSKLAGEEVATSILEKLFIVRISWVFGKNGNNFVKTMLRLAEDRSELNVVADQIGSPTYTVDLAGLLCDMVLTEKYGVYHATNEGTCSWAEFAEEIFRQSRLGAKVNPIPARDYPTKAVRPYNSVMDKTCLGENGFRRLSNWKDALKRYLE